MTFTRRIHITDLETIPDLYCVVEKQGKLYKQGITVEEISAEFKSRKPPQKPKIVLESDLMNLRYYLVESMQKHLSTVSAPNFIFVLGKMYVSLEGLLGAGNSHIPYDEEEGLIITDKLENTFNVLVEKALQLIYKQTHTDFNSVLELRTSLTTKLEDIFQFVEMLINIQENK